MNNLNTHSKNLQDDNQSCCQLFVNIFVDTFLCKPPNLSGNEKDCLATMSLVLVLIYLGGIGLGLYLFINGLIHHFTYWWGGFGILMGLVIIPAIIIMSIMIYKLIKYRNYVYFS